MTKSKYDYGGGVSATGRFGEGSWLVGRSLHFWRIRSVLAGFEEQLHT